MSLVYVLIITCGMPTCSGGEPFVRSFATAEKCDAMLGAFMAKYPGHMYSARCVATRAYKPLK